MTVTEITDILVKLSKMQDALNCFIDKSWKVNRSLDDWSLAIILEAAELIESYPWKWWKNLDGPVDMKNVRIELVDILHFALSGASQANCLNSSSALKAEMSREIELTSNVTKGTKEAVQIYRQIIRDADNHDFQVLVHKVFAIADHYDFNIIGYYLAKHTLNIIRQIGGYKKNKYQKINDQGMEDNELLHQVISNITSADIIQDFEGIANSILTKVYDVFDIPMQSRNTIEKWIE